MKVTLSWFILTALRSTSFLSFVETDLRLLIHQLSRHRGGERVS